MLAHGRRSSNLQPPSTSFPSSQQVAPSEFRATVTEIRERRRVAGKPVFEIALDHSCFAPSQGADTACLGTLTATSRMGTVLVAPITAVHRDDDGELWHTTVKPLQSGTPVIVQVLPVAENAV